LHSNHFGGEGINLIKFTKMKRNYFLPFACLLLLFAACRKETIPTDLPDCIRAKIEAIDQEGHFSPVAEVWKWEVNNEVYYYVSNNCCDRFNELFDPACNRICAPDGGITGNGDGICPNWQATIQKTLVWRDS
jgi:hypothetical protein